jgi:hypothetical protein
MLTTLERAKLTRRIAYNGERIARLERQLQGEPLGTIRFEDASIINAKVGSLSASKLTTGRLSVNTNFDIGNTISGNYIRKSGENGNIILYNNGVSQAIIGLQSGVPVVKIALNGINALTDTNPNNFVLYVDQTIDHILIKEKSRGSQSVSAYSNQSISHSLGYIPFCLVFYEVSSGVYRKVHGVDNPASPGMPYYQISSSNVILYNPTASSKIMKYYIFYDQIV